MNFFTIGFYYISWHYTRGIKDLIGVFINLIWFVWHYFSISVLFRTLFTPFKRLKEDNKKFNIESWLESIVVTTIMRIVGLILRLFVISAGILSSIGMIFLSMISLLVWIILPLFLTFVFVASLIALIK